MPATIRPAYWSDKGFARSSGREKHAEPGDPVQVVTACTMQRQAKRLRAETEATDYSTIAPGLRKTSDIRGYRLKACQRETRVEAPFSLWSPRTVSLFGQVPKREMGLDLRSSPPAYTTQKTDSHAWVQNLLGMMCSGRCLRTKTALQIVPQSCFCLVLCERVYS